LHAAALAGQWAVVPALLAAGADASAQDFDPEYDGRFASTTFEESPEQHRTALHYAAALGNVLVVRALLEARADPNTPDSCLDTPLHLCLALRERDAEVEAGSGVRIVGHPALDGRLGAAIEPAGERWSVLLEGEAEAREVGCEDLRLLADETLDALLAARADVNLGGRAIGETRSVLHEAARRRDVALAERCISAGAALDRRDSKLGLTALHLAARSKDHDLIALLLRARADPALQSAGGRTALELAETNGAAPATLALFAGEGLEQESPAQSVGPSQPQTLATLTAEQRAMMFLD